MVEVAMVRRMTRRGLSIAPLIVAAVWVFTDARGGWSAAAGLALTLGNLWLAARLIGGVADKTPALLMPVALATFALGLIILTAIALGLRAADLVDFPITGLALIGTHLGLVLWEAAGAYSHADGNTADVRS